MEWYPPYDSLAVIAKLVGAEVIWIEDYRLVTSYLALYPVL